MSNLSKLEFVALDITVNDYLSWVLDAEIHLEAKGLGDTIKQGNKSSSQDKAKAMIFLRHHLNEIEYLTVKDPLELWNNLKDRYEHLKMTVLPRARYDWIYLRLQDFETVTDYNSAIHQNNTLLMKNHESRPTGFAPFPEVNAATGYDNPERRQNNYRGRGHGRGCGR
ncbi:uncharacterized protein LOC132066071 [Lycium ferocissimum]|uniref:uncharacterized protein LOC132066071 n=1 Tax=Lycium ferocissimum TaxID=112874 RepID=UPI0028150E97|nr:uncharacterized protein LOC132066071 [Lycium ferocissimum]